MSVRRTLTIVAVALIAQVSVATDLSLLQTFIAPLACSSSMNWATETDVCSWDGVTCDGNNAVTEFDISYESCSGSVTTWALPATLQTLYMYSNSLTGTVPSFSGLPASLQDFELQNNDLSGSIDLSMLPAAMTTISVRGNSFTGTIDLTTLPASISTVDASYNQLSGTVDLRKLPASMEYCTLSDNSFTGLLISNVSASMETIDLSYNTLNGMNMDLSMLPASGQSDVLELYSNPGICGTYNPAICYAIWAPYQCTCTNNVMTCNCASPAPWTPYPPGTPYPWTPYPPGTPYPWTPLPPFTWSPGSWTWSPSSWSPASWSPSTPTTPSPPVPTSPPNAPTAVWLTVSRSYSYNAYNTTDVYMQWLLAGYFGVSATAITVMHAPSSGIYTTYSIQFSDTTMIVGGASITAAAMATTVLGYYTNQLYYTLQSSNFYVSDVAYNYYPVQKKTAPMVVSLTLYRYSSGSGANVNLNTLVQATLAAYFTVPITSITVTTKNSTSNSVYTYTTLSVTFTDTTTTSTAAIPNQPVSGATMAYALTDYNQNGLYSSFSASSLYVVAASADQTSDSEKSKVPIIVGVIVGVVVLIAIIAFIANRQSGSTGRSDQDYVAMGGKPMV